MNRDKHQSGKKRQQRTANVTSDDKGLDDDRLGLNGKPKVEGTQDIWTEKAQDVLVADDNSEDAVAQ
jgi:hypothetical protein